jgi:hypothetical protein
MTLSLYQSSLTTGSLHPACTNPMSGTLHCLRASVEQPFLVPLNAKVIPHIPKQQAVWFLTQYFRELALTSNQKEELACLRTPTFDTI